MEFAEGMSRVVMKNDIVSDSGFSRDSFRFQNPRRILGSKRMQRYLISN